METLPPPISLGRALALAAPPTIRGEGSATHPNPGLVDVHFYGVSHDDPPPQTYGDELTKEAPIGGDNATSKI